MDDLFLFGQQALNAQPFSRLLGAQLAVFRREVAELTIPITAELLQQHGFVHGGVLSYAADNALTFAGGSVLGPAVVNAAYTINYLKPARGIQLIARAMVVSSGSRQVVCRCDIFSVADDGELLCAIAQGTVVMLNETPAKL